MADNPTTIHWHSDKRHINPEAGQVVIERTYSDGYPGPTPAYLGTGSISAPQGPVFEFEFSIAAKSVKEAFLRYESHMRPAGEENIKKLQEAERQAMAKNASRLVGTDGRKLS